MKIETKSWDTKSGSSGNSKRRKCLTIKLLNARSRVIDIRPVLVLVWERTKYACMFHKKERK